MTTPTASMPHKSCLFSLLVTLACLLGGLFPAQATPVGGIMSDFTMTTLVNGSPTGPQVRRSDFDGKVLVLDFFAYWCGPCKASSPDVEANVQQYYESRGGNRYGVPVQVVAVSVDDSSPSQTSQFVDQAGISFATTNSPAGPYSQFAQGGIPLFVIVACVPGSPSHSKYQVLYVQAGYAGAATLRSYIDQVKSGVPAEIAVETPTGTEVSDGSTITFDTVGAGSSGAAKTVTIRNTGTGDLTGIAVSKTGTNASEFNVSTSGMLSTVPPGSSTSFTVIFSPTTAGTKTAALQISSNDADENPYDLTLSGVCAAAPEIAINGPGNVELSDNVGAFNFGTTTAGTPTDPQTFTIRNTGTGPLTGIAISKNGTNASDFTVDTTNLSSNVPIGGSTTFSITFNPGAAGSRSAAIHVTSTDADESPFDILLLGAGTPPAGPEIAVEQPEGANLGDGIGSVNFGSAYTGASSEALTFVIRNLGNSDLTDIAITCDGTNPGDFTVDTSSTATTLAPSAVTSFTVTFAPGSAGTRTAVIHVASNDANENPFDITVIGNALQSGGDTFSAADLEGNWRYQGAAEGDAPAQRPGWYYGTHSVNETGMVTSSTPLTDSIGNNTDPPPSPGQISLSPEGIMTMGGGTLHGVMTGGKDFMLGVGTLAPGSASRVNGFNLQMYMKQSTAVYAPADLGGTWRYHGLTTGDSPGQRPGWYYGTHTVDATGNVVSSTQITDSMGTNEDPPPTVGQITLSANGEFTMNDGLVRGVMSANKDLMVSLGTYAPGSASRVNGYNVQVCLKQTGESFAVSDLTGTWRYHGLAAGDSPVQRPGWFHGAHTINSSGVVTSSSVVTDSMGNNNYTPPDMGQVSITSDGVVTMKNGIVRGVMNGSKDMIVAVGTMAPGANNGVSGHNLIIFTKDTSAFVSPPVAPIALPANPITQNAFTARWNAAPGATGYRVEVALNQGFTAGYMSVNVGYVTSYAVAGLAAGSTYYYKVTSSNAAGTGGTSDIVAVTTLSSAPDIAVEQPAGNSLTDESGAVDYGSVSINTAGLSKTFLIRNLGTMPLTGISISKGGTNAAEFSLSTAGTATTLAAGNSTSITVTFAPTTTGPKSASIHITSSDPDESPFDITLTGTAVFQATPVIAVEQPLGNALTDGGSAIDFGSANTSSTGTSLVFTVRNTGAGNLTGLAVTKDGSSPAEFLINTTGMLTTLIPGRSTTFTVTFAPQSPGTRAADIHVSGTNADLPVFDIPVTGNANAVPEIAVEQPEGTDLTDGSGTLDFGSVISGGTGVVKTFTIRNLGTGPLTGLSITKDGLHSADYWVNTTGTATTLAAGASTTFSVTFTPSALGLRAAALHIGSNDSDESPFDISFLGRGITPPAPAISVEQPTGTALIDGGPAVNFGSLTAGSSGIPLTFTIRNTGTANLTGISVAKGGTDGTSFVLNNATTASSLAPGATTTFTVTFAPAAPGAKSAALLVTSNAAEHNPFSIGLAGTGLSSGPTPDISVEQPSGSVLTSGDTRNFGTVALRKKVTMTFTVRNTGNADLTGTTVLATGANAPEFKVTAKLTAPIKPGKSKTFKVQFAPASPGAKTAQLVITSNDLDESPFIVNLVGNSVLSISADKDVATKEAAAKPTTAKAASAAGQSAAADSAVDLSETTWTLPAVTRVSATGNGIEEGQGHLKLTFHADGSLTLADDSGVAMEGAYTVDEAGNLVATVFPQGVEDYVRAALGSPSGCGVAVEAADLSLELVHAASGPVLQADFGFDAWISWHDSDSDADVREQLTYDATASGTQD